jgi:hypothetical protein
MRRKRSPAKRIAAGAALKKVCALAFDMEEPLNDARDYVRALRLIGDGLIAVHDDDGRAVLTCATAAMDRLDAITEQWRGICKALGGRA